MFSVEVLTDECSLRDGCLVSAQTGRVSWTSGPRLATQWVTANALPTTVLVQTRQPASLLLSLSNANINPGWSVLCVVFRQPSYGVFLL